MSTANPELGLMHDLEPTVEKLLNRHLSIADKPINLWVPDDYVPYSEGQNFTTLRGVDGVAWTPDQVKLSKAATTSLELNLLTEDNLPSYHFEIATAFGRDGAWGTWVHRWTAEEGRHARAIQNLLVVTRASDPATLERERMQAMQSGYSANSKSPLGIAVYVTFQELATRVAHRNTGTVCAEDGDTVAEKLMIRISKDEGLHKGFYGDLVAEAFDQAPNETMRAVAEEVKGFAMPGARAIDNFDRRALIIAKAGIYNLRVHHDDVVQPILRELKVFTRTDLTGDGNKAREELAEFMEGLDSLATLQQEKFLEHAARVAARA